MILEWVVLTEELLNMYFGIRILGRENVTQEEDEKVAEGLCLDVEPLTGGGSVLQEFFCRVKRQDSFGRVAGIDEIEDVEVRRLYSLRRSMMKIRIIYKQSSTEKSAYIAANS